MLCFVVICCLVNACHATSETYAFQRIDTGNCQDQGLFPISDSQVCGVAAWRLGMPDIQPTISERASGPEGCYYIYDGPRPLYLNCNVNPASKGIGFTEEEDGTSRHPICSTIANHSMLNVVSRPGSCQAATLTQVTTEEYFACLTDTCTSVNHTILHEMAKAGRFSSFVQWDSIFKCPRILMAGALCNSTFRDTRLTPISNEALFGEELIDQAGDIPLARFCPRFCGQCLTSDFTSTTDSLTQEASNSDSGFSMGVFCRAMMVATLMAVAWLV